jgi:hypothetical protein
LPLLAAAGPWSLLLFSPAPVAAEVGVDLDETGGKHEVRYRSGEVTYVEDLQAGC